MRAAYAQVISCDVMQSSRILWSKDANPWAPIGQKVGYATIPFGISDEDFGQLTFERLSE